MAKRRKTVGTGITVREVLAYDGEDIDPAMEAFARRWNAARAQGGGDFGAEVLNVEASCRRILEGAGAGPFAADSPPDFAKRIQEAIARTKATIRRGQTELAARYALELGKLITEANMKGRWEAHALHGQKAVSNLKAARPDVSKNRRAAADKLREKRQERADAIWRKNEHLRKFDVARRIADDKKIGGNADTIRRQIKQK